MQRVAILGYGLEGKSLLSYFKKEKNAEITILDRDKNIKIPMGVKKNLGKNYLKNLSEFDVIFRSPGVPYHLREIQRANKKITSLTGLFFEEARKRGATVIGVTGSVGKTTTATLLYRILKSASWRSGKEAFLVGNIGINPLAYLGKLSPKSIVVMELSSFQLQDLKRSPQVAVVLDIFEEHLDKHKNFKEYLFAKSNIVKYQKKSDVVLYAADNSYSSAMGKLSPAKKIQVSVSEGLKKRYKLKTLGAHNFKNSLAAEKVAMLFKVPEKISRKVIESFRGIEHRIELVRNVRGVKYYNNSKATNIASATAGIDAFSGKKIVLVGGYNKNLNLLPLVKRLSRQDVRRAVFFGACRDELTRLSKKINFSNFVSSKKLSEAVRSAHRLARRGDIVVLSPGTASFDEFKNYEERGRRFKEWVRKLK